MHYSLKSFWSFYSIAVLIVFGVMAAVLFSNSTALMGELYRYMQDKPAYPNVVSIGNFSWRIHWGGWLVLLFAAAPTIAAIAVCGFSRHLSLKNLFARLLPIGPQATGAAVGRVYLALFGSYGAVLAIYLGITFHAGDADIVQRTWSVLGGSWPLIFAWCAIAPFLDEGGLLEELGWRGFAWPALQSLLASSIRAAIVLGILWWAWHLPREIPTLLAGDGLAIWVWHQSLFLLLCVAESIICGYLVNLCGGSVLPAILVHGGSNVWSKAASSEIYRLTGGLDVRMLIMVVIAALILWRVGGGLGRQDD